MDSSTSTTSFDFKQILITITISTIVILVESSMLIETSEKSIVQWEGCLYKRYGIYPSDQNPCSECANDGTKLAIFNTPTSQNYKNCSRQCKKPTVCTDYKYNIDGIWRSECYQCENGRKDDLKFRFVQIYKICSELCKTCAKEADLSTSIHCAFKCKGKPTFCYPKEFWFGHQKCYQTNKIYGCHYEQVDKSSLSNECVDCALAAVKKDAQECAPDCNGIPSYHSTPIAENATAEILEPIIYQCRIGFYHELFDVDIPRDILHFIRNQSLPHKSKSIHSPALPMRG